MSGSSRIVQRVVRQVQLPVADIPVFLCPALLSFANRPFLRNSRSQPQPRSQILRRRNFTTSIRFRSLEGGLTKAEYALAKLPQQCTGCGALSQIVNKDGPGFYTLTRNSVRHFLEGLSGSKDSEEEAIIKQALEKAAASGLKLGEFSTPNEVKDPPVCDRCHQLKHHETGVSIMHPSIQSIQDTIFESPHKYNHVYHVLDAADFPMSVIPGLHKLLNITPMRSLNRRSKTGRFYHGKKTDISFVITRSDLLAPKKEQVDSLMPYIRETLREALGRSAQDVRLGNIRLVSAKNDWWTKELKEEVWKRGGAGWMVGKVNVGKSALFHDVFPKGRREKDKVKLIKPVKMEDKMEMLKGDLIALGTSRPKALETSLEEDELVDSSMAEKSLETTSESDGTATEQVETWEPANSNSLEEESSFAALKASFEKPQVEEEEEDFDTAGLDTSSLLPPAPPEVDYPTMPLVSSLPGTTASPIRLSFGNGKGELIDLPGLARGDLELHVQPEHRNTLVMKSRITPEQQVIKPGQSLLLGGFIRITPTNPDILILSYAFTPLNAHLTSTEKAIGIQTRTRETTVENISLPETGKKIRSAGKFYLKHDVTRPRTGPITSSKAGIGISPDKLPYKVLALDLLIEGCGWVELVAQVRKRPGESSSPPKPQKKDYEFDFGGLPEQEVIDPSWPEIEVFSPEGRFVGQRKPMNAWLFVVKKKAGRKNKLQGRPRKSMKGAKKREKIRSRGQSVEASF